MRDRPSFRLATALALILAACAGCAEKLVGPAPAVHLRVPFGLKGGAATSFHLTVSAADMDTVRAFMLPTPDGWVEARLEITPGNDRRFVGEARDDDGLTLYRGEAMLDVRPVRGLELDLDLRPVVPMFYLSPHFAEVQLEQPFTVTVRAANLVGLDLAELNLAWDVTAPVELDSVATAPGLQSRGVALEADGAGFRLAAEAPLVDGNGNGDLAVYHFSTFDGWDGDTYPLQFDLEISAVGGTAVAVEDIRLDRSQIRLGLEYARARLLGDRYEDGGHDITALGGGGYAVAGIATWVAGNDFRRVPTLRRLDAAAEPLWLRSYDEGTPRYALGVAEAAGGGLFVGGRRTDADDVMDAGFVFHADGAGEPLWQDEFAFVGAPSEIAAVAARPGGGAVAVGVYRRGSETQPLIASFGAAGYEAHLQLAGDPDYADPTRFQDVVVLSDREFAAVGTEAAVVANSFRERIVLHRFAQDPLLRQVWSRHYEAPAELLFGWDLALTPAGGFLLVGWNGHGGGTRAFALMTDASGNEIWRNTYGQDWESARCVVAAPGGGYLIAGETNVNRDGRGRDVYVVKIDEAGNPLWERSYGGRGDDTAIAVCRRPEGGYLITGSSDSGSADGVDVLLLRLDESGLKAVRE